MVSIGKKYSPVSARVTRHGDRTMFSVPQSHREGSKFVRDGFIQIIADGVFDFRKGDIVKVDKITGCSVTILNGKPYTALFCDIEYITLEDDRAGNNKTRLDEDIPEDLL